ncbi:ABC transporter ATP-binding protein [Desulfobacula sp.]
MVQAIELTNLSFRYKAADTFALKDIEFLLEQGQCAAIMGPSGSGKTTLCQCLKGLIPQAVEGELKGCIKVAGKNLSLFRVQTMARTIGLVMQDPEVQIVGRTVYEDAAFGPRNFLVPKDEINKRVSQSLSLVGLDGYESRCSNELSGGEKQRLTIAGVLAMNPEILVLDEPASELDPRGRKEIYRHLENLRQRTGLSMIIVEQKIDDIFQMIDKVIILNDGHMKWEGKPENISSANTLFTGCVFPIYPRGQESDKNLHPGNEMQLPALKVKGLNFSYTPGKSVLEDINLSIYQNDFLALVGHNGAGKTSLVKHLNGLIPYKSGSICFYKEDIKTMTLGELSQSVGYVFQNPDHQIFENSVEKEISFGLSNRGLSENHIKTRVNETIEYMGLSAVRNDHPFTLGKGLRQIIAVASIVALKPKILIVDEPTTGLDSSGSQKIMNIIEKLYYDGTAIILISHDLELVKNYAKRLVVLNHGKIILDEKIQQALLEKETLEDAGLYPIHFKRAANQ